ncbi:MULTISPECIES: hypothetical protein [unclassified Caulobacter]|uniref:hypothetical protein n=1 Tax=unclassified Caulobacter TaxID=2648921 RepID=UPI0018EE50E8|nr:MULTISPECIES: hypothetical protein [unclassified Caulobacter]
MTFFDIHRRPGTFDLVKEALDTDELCRALPRRARDRLEWFDEVDDQPTEAATT